jgi:hypothetical protein
MRSLLLILLSHFLLLCSSEGEFTCQGATYATALKNCPDLGSQRFSSGGNVSVLVKSVKNLPDRDVMGSSATSDPYVEFTVGKNFKYQSSVILNDVSPKWNEIVNLGLLGSGTEMLVKIYDADYGLEFGDDLLVHTSMRVPFCSTFNASYDTITCDTPFNCKSHDSLWAMPTRQVCHEVGEINMKPKIPCGDPGSICLQLEFFIVPFQMQVEMEIDGIMAATPEVSVAGDFNPTVPWQKSNAFGFPYLSDITNRFDFRTDEYNHLEGGLIFRTLKTDRYAGKVNEVLFYGGVNFPAYIYICRDLKDNANGVPSWILKDYNAKNLSTTKMAFFDQDDRFECYYKSVSGTYKNRWGGIRSGYLTFRSNTIEGHDNGKADSTFYLNNYFIIAIPRVIVPPYEDLSIGYDAGGFISKLFEHGVVWAFFAFLAAKFLKRINYRIDRVMTFLVSRVYTGDAKSILSTLFFPCENQSPCNVEFRSHLCHAQNVVYFLLSIPHFLLISWGFSCVAVVTPPSLGYGIVFLGGAALLLWYGYRLWESRDWHMSPYALLSQILSVMLFFCFIVCIIFSDPAVYKYDHPISLPALSVLSGCINVIPLFLLIFQRDKAYKINLSVVVEKLTETVYLIKNEKNKKTNKKPLAINKVLHALLGDSYTLNPNVPLFKYGTILMDTSNSAKSSEKDKNSRKLMQLSLVILFIYLMIAIARTDHPSIAFLHCLALILLDSIHTSISHGDVKWTSGYHIFLLVAGRLLITSSSINLWILNYSVAYMIYAAALIRELINSFLPALTKEQAGEIAFAGKHSGDATHPDIAGSPLFCFGILTFAFVSILLIAAFARPDALPIVQIDVWGAQWSTYVFGMAAFLLIIVGGLMTATVRAFYLQKHNLLQGYARDSYTFDPRLRLPLLLAIFTEVAIICSGILIYGATGTAAVLTVAIFLPPIIVCLGHAAKTWVDNDYDLIVWPPKETKPDHVDDAPSDLEVAFHMMDNIFGDTVNEGDMVVEDIPETENMPPPEKTLKGFALPPMDSTGTALDASAIKMPALPLKSALRKKRQNMGIATSGAPLVDDLRAREGANADQIGEGDVLDSNDPWGQFDKEEEDDETAKLISQKKRNDGERVGIFEHPFYLKMKAAILGNAVGAWLARNLSACVKFIKTRTRSYQKVDSTDDQGGNEVEAFEEPKEPATEEETGVVAVSGPVRVSEMPFWSAVFAGYLTRSEYLALWSWFGGMFLIFIMGNVLAATSPPEYMGHVIWVATIILICTVVPIVKYFNTYVIDDTIKHFVYFLALIHVVFSFSFFGAALDGNADTVASLWMLDYLVYYPLFVYLGIQLYKWRDDGWIIEKLDKDGDGDVTWKEYVVYFQAYPVIFAGIVLLIFQMYVWVGVVIGNIGLLMLLTSMIGYIFARDWATNDFFLSENLTKAGDYVLQFIILVTFLTSLFYPDNPAFPLSVFFFTFVFRCASKIFGRVIVAEPDTVIFMSPFVMPVYSYNSSKNDIVNEEDLAKQIATILLAGALWGTFMAMFLYPVSVGVIVACVFLMIIFAIVSYAVSYVPLRMGDLAAMMSPETMMNAVNAALEKFDERRSPLETTMIGWEGGDIDDYEEQDMLMLDEDRVDGGQKAMKKTRTALELATELIDDTRAMQYVRDDKPAKIINIEDEDEIVLPWYQKYWNQFVAQMKVIYESIFPPGLYKGYRKHSEALLSLTDMIAEALLTGRGPMGFVGLEGLWYMLFKKAQQYPQLKFLQQPWLNAYDNAGNLTTTAQLAESFETSVVLKRQVVLDREIDRTLHEEMRCGIHFLLMIIVAADAKLHREKILFQKFLRENRFRLASNGISPPPEVFTSSSYASIDIPLVAVWLTTLSPEERDRFHMLKKTFSEEQLLRDEAIDNEDYRKSMEASKLAQLRTPREHEMFHRTNHEIQLRQAERVRAFVEHLSPQDKQVFLFNKEEWLNEPGCFVNPKDEELYANFKAAVMHDTDEVVEYARQVLADVEAARRDCRIGEFGRSYQFVDPEFTPGDGSIGDTEAQNLVSVWKCAPGISDACQLFDAGTDPDDVEVGVFKTEWLLSAISMLAAAGGIGDGGVDEQILNLFVGHYGIDGLISYHTEVGAYCVRLYKTGMWLPIIVDDIFPTLKEDKWTNENKGIATAHSKEVKEIWVSLIEKAFAKYYGSYASIERGYVHHALTDMTGCESECLSLNAYCRGPRKRVLWDMLLRYRRNGYILGAGTGSSTLADKGIVEMGIIFDAAYTIYDVRQVDFHQLIKLRNPPGDHDEWKGDWSDGSSLWTKRLKKKLNWSDDANDNTFWMSFDDFCNVFRDLYICKWYDLNRWACNTMNGAWHKNNKDSLEAADPDNMDDMEDDEEMAARQKQANLPDTAGGLPSKHNPGCVLENNPFYSLVINRPTEIRLTLTQVNARGVAKGDPLPAAIYLCRSPHSKVALRLKKFLRDDVVAYSGACRADRTIHLYANLKPGVYVVLAGTYITGMEGNFTLTLLSNYKTNFTQLWPPTWLQAGQSFNPSAMLDGPEEIQYESAFVKQSLEKIRVGLGALMGTGEKPEAREEASDDGVEEEDLTQINEEARKYREEQAKQNKDVEDLDV